MVKMTTAAACKLVRKLSEDKTYWRALENEGSTYIAAIDEEPVIPEYDYATVAKKIDEIDDKIMRIKHAVNLSNATNVVMAGDVNMTIDTILIKMAQLNYRKSVLDEMRKRPAKARINSSYMSSRKAAPEFEYINYDLEVVKKEYEVVDEQITQMQMALDKFNQTFEIEVDI